MALANKKKLASAIRWYHLRVCRRLAIAAAGGANIRQAFVDSGIVDQLTPAQLTAWKTFDDKVVALAQDPFMAEIESRYKPTHRGLALGPIVGVVTSEGTVIEEEQP